MAIHLERKGGTNAGLGKRVGVGISAASKNPRNPSTNPANGRGTGSKGTKSPIK